MADSLPSKRNEINFVEVANKFKYNSQLSELRQFQYGIRHSVIFTIRLLHNCMLCFYLMIMKIYQVIESFPLLQISTFQIKRARSCDCQFIVKMKFVVKAFLLMVLTFFIFIVQTNSISKEDEHEFIHGLLGSCKNRENGSEDDMKILENMQVPETREGKCMMACVLETIGIVSNTLFQL